MIKRCSYCKREVNRKDIHKKKCVVCHHRFFEYVTKDGSTISNKCIYFD